MDLTRDHFIEHYYITFDHNCLKMWRRKSKGPPTFIADCLYEWIKISSGRITATPGIFSHVVAPVIERLHTETEGKRPGAKHFTGLVYDALDAAGIEVTIKPPATHSR